jgi:hypothetical protein
VDLTRKNIDFVWLDIHQIAFENLKAAVTRSPALRAIDYGSGLEVIIAVDSSPIAVGFVLLQLGEDGRRYPVRFGSICFTERESRYSQAKLELYGVFRALRYLKLDIIGITNLTLEVDASYIKGMLNNPDIQPCNATNRWIAAILLFSTKL